MSGRNITGPAAVFSVFIAIALKLLSAVLAHQIIICFSVDILLVAVPPCHPAGIGAKFLLPATFGLHQRSAAIFAGFGTGDIGMSMNVGPNRAGGQTQLGGDHGRTVSLQPHIVNGDFILQSHIARQPVQKTYCTG